MGECRTQGPGEDLGKAGLALGFRVLGLGLWVLGFALRVLGLGPCPSTVINQGLDYLYLYIYIYTHHKFYQAVSEWVQDPLFSSARLTCKIMLRPKEAIIAVAFLSSVMKVLCYRWKILYVQTNYLEI